MFQAYTKSYDVFLCQWEEIYSSVLYSLLNFILNHCYITALASSEDRNNVFYFCMLLLVPNFHRPLFHHYVSSASFEYL